MISDITTANPLVTKEDLGDHKSVGLIVRNHYKPDHIAIFFHEKYQFYTIPIDKCQDILYGVMTEAKEELGIDVVMFNDIAGFTKTYDRGNGIKTTVECHLIDIESYNGEPFNAEPDKHPSMLWCTLEEIVLMMAHDKKFSDMTIFCVSVLRILERGSIK